MAYGRRPTLAQVKNAILAAADEYQEQIDKLEALYFLEIDELGENEDEPEWVMDLGLQIDHLKLEKEKLGKTRNSVEAAIAEVQFKNALKGAFGLLLRHLK